MAKINENPKGFKVIEVSFKERTSWGGFGICDDCGNAFDRAYYIAGICDDCGNAFDRAYYVAVLNRVLCEECYNEWYAEAINYEEDREVEERNFQAYKRMLKI